jgi:hypothetical protein
MAIIYCGRPRALDGWVQVYNIFVIQKGFASSRICRRNQGAIKMGQVEVFEWLKNQREGGRDCFFSIKEIEDGLRAVGNTDSLIGLRGDVFRLCICDYVEYQDLDKTGLNNYKKVFRCKLKYCNGFKEL